MEGKFYEFYFNSDELRSRTIVADSFDKAYQSLSKEEKESIINVYGKTVTLVK